MAAEGLEIRPEDIMDVAYSLEQPLSDFGVSNDEILILINFLQKNVENIQGPEDFINGLQGALTMIAYGYPNMIDPTPGDMLEF